MFSYAHGFHIDPSRVGAADTVFIKKIDLYFHSKPSIDANKSGIYAPGIELYIVPIKNEVPWLEYWENLIETEKVYARVSYSEIYTSSDGSRETSFVFPIPVKVNTDIDYAFVVKIDGDEDFVFAQNRIGSKIINSNDISTGNFGNDVGKLYQYIGLPASITSSANVSGVYGGTNNTSIYSSAALTDNWKAISGTSLKFNLYLTRFSHAGEPVQSNTDIIDDPMSGISNTNKLVVLGDNSIQITCPAYPQEYIKFDKKTSNTDNFRYGDKFFQKGNYYPGSKATPATVAVIQGEKAVNANSSYILSNGSNFSFENILNIAENFVVISLNHYGANQHAINVRKVFYSTNTTIYADEAFTFTNNAAYFYKTPVGRLSAKDRTFLNGSFIDFVVLSDSAVSPSCRFVNSVIDTHTINVAGNGYSNSDYLVVTGYENVSAELEGGYSAIANVQTNSNGGITNLYFSNCGSGFSNADAIAYTIYNSSNTASNGTSANISFSTNCVIYNELGNMLSYLSKAEIVNLEATQVIPEFNVNNPPGTNYSLSYKTLYYSVESSNTSSGIAYYISDNPEIIDMKNMSMQNFSYANTPIIPSRSNQFSIRHANGATANGSVIGGIYSNVACFILRCSSNNDYVALQVKPDKVASHYAKYSINNDYTNEHTNYGNAFAKHITEKVNFEDGRFAEDVLVYITGHRPANTDFKVYARLHNSHDNEAFDDKNWTLLEQIGGIDVYSSLTDSQDLKEFTYGLPLYPNSEFICSGSVVANLNSANIIGSNTTFTSNLAINDMIKVYDPLFPNNYTIAIVNSISNNTLLTIKTAISNSSLTGSGLKLDKIAYPMQAFKNYSNENVVRYYSSSHVEYDTYDTLQLKIIFLSPSDHIIPKIDDIEGFGVTA